MGNPERVEGRRTGSDEEIAEGMFADITIFNPQTVIDRATFEAPNQYPVGVPYVIVNGQLSVDEGKRTAAPAGKPLRGPRFKR